MALITRFSRLLRADLHAVLDNLEEPDVLLRQAVREMEEALATDEARLARLRQEQVLHRRRAAELEEAIAGLDAELDVCFEADAADLARTLCRRKLETARALDITTRRIGPIAEEVATLEARCREERARFESMRQKAELMVGDEPPRDSGDPFDDGLVSDEAVEVAFLREQRKRRAS